MSSHELDREAMLAALPISLRKDPSVAALAQSIAEILDRRRAEIDNVSLYAHIDSLPEELLDILAYDFKVDWWSPDYSLEEKRQTLKDSWRVHRMLGTKAAVETAIAAIYPRTQVLEWWEYGGEPYHFRLDINITGDSVDSEKQRRVLERMDFYKSLRSHNDGVTYFMEAEPVIAKTGVCTPGVWESVHIPMELPVPIIQPVAVARTGGCTGLFESFSARMELPMPVIRPVVTARAGAIAGRLEAFSTGLELNIPPVRGAVCARTGAGAAWSESFSTMAVPLEAEPPRSRAVLGAAIATAFTECHTTGAIVLKEETPTVTAKAHAAGAVAAAQETAETHIDL